VGRVSRKQRYKTRGYETIHRQLIINTFSQSDALWAGVHAKLLKFRPPLVVGYVSSLEQFSRYLLAAGRSLPGVRAVIAAAEPLHQPTRRIVEEAIGAPVFNTYGSREFMSVAAECGAHGGLHVHCENLLVETRAATADRPSEVLVTDLHNYGMPFVRYATGDLGVLMAERCACGRALPMIRSLEGRILETLLTADGRMVPGEFFPHLLKDVPEFAQYLVEQDTPEHLTISAVLNAPISETSRALLRSEITKVFGTTTSWSIRAVDCIPQLASGKRRVTIQRSQGAAPPC
jgi:phenylacetate-CoA ligase